MQRIQKLEHIQLDQTPTFVSDLRNNLEILKKLEQENISFNPQNEKIYLKMLSDIGDYITINKDQSGKVITGKIRLMCDKYHKYGCHKMMMEAWELKKQLKPLYQNYLNLS